MFIFAARLALLWPSNSFSCASRISAKTAACSRTFTRREISAATSELKGGKLSKSVTFRGGARTRRWVVGAWKPIAGPMSRGP